ncbi:MAG: M24 family metallopeptidase, partial [Vicinamibacteria bacterium]
MRADRHKPRRARPLEASLLYADTERDANLLYATRIFVPDPFIFFQIGRRKFAVMSDLEIDRARKQADVDRVLSLSDALGRARGCCARNPGVADVISLLLAERGVRRLVVPSNFPLGLAQALWKRRFHIRVKPDPFHEEREIKSDEEIRWIGESVRAAEAGMEAAVAVLRRAKIRSGRDLYLDGARLTSERLKSVINSTIQRAGAV